MHFDISQQSIRDIRALLQAIYDLIDDEDAAEPLDDAIAHAKKALVIIDSSTLSRPNGGGSDG